MSLYVYGIHIAYTLNFCPHCNYKVNASLLIETFSSLTESSKVQFVLGYQLCVK